MVTGLRVPRGAYGCERCLRVGAWCSVLVLSAGCSVPASREREFAAEQIAKAAELKSSQVEREGFAVLADDGLMASVEMSDGKVIRFARVGYNSFGSNASNVVVAEAGGLVPRIASCGGVAFPNFHREGALGHHFQPTLIDVTDAVRRSREVLEEVQFWPACPQSWEVQDKFGANYRYCAHRKDAPADPPRPSTCP